MNKPLFYIYKCDVPGCDMEYATKIQPLSCPYCDHTALDDEPIKGIYEMTTQDYGRANG